MDTARDHVKRLMRLGLLRAMRRGYSVYVLLVDGELVYVGQTCDPTDRLKLHKRQRKDFTVLLKVKCVVETQDEAVRVEQALIDSYRKQGFDLENSYKASGTSVRGMNETGEVLDNRSNILPRSGKLTKALSKEELKARRQQIQKMIQGSARMAEIDK